MKAFLALTCFILFSNFIHAQNLTLDQVMSLRDKSLAEVEEFLTTRNWEMKNATEPDESNLGTASFAFNKNLFDDKATAFITYHYAGNVMFNRVNIQISTLQAYNLYMSRLKALNYKIVNSKVVSGQIVKVYKGKNLTVRVSSSTYNDEFATRTIYQFFICSSADYEIMFAG
jgi:hypothetical protein